MTIKQAFTIIASLATISPGMALGAPETYQVTACNSTPGGINNSWNWSTSDNAHYENHSQCPYPLGGSGGTIDQDSGLSSTDRLAAISGAQPESNAGWTFTAPNGTTINAITYERYLGHDNDTSNTWSPALRADNTIIDEQTCTVTFPSVGCVLGGPPGHGELPTTITGLAAKQLTFGELCKAPHEQECVTGNSQHVVWAAMYGAAVTLNDPTPPALDTPTGPLWTFGKTNGYHKDIETVTTTAQDIGGGVQSITLASDGNPIKTYKAPCDYTLPQPCPSSTEQALTLPTTELSDGTHTLTLFATDVAGNTSPIASKQVTIDNNPPPPPTELTGTATQPEGTTFTVTWTNPPGQVAPITSATYQVCATASPEICGPLITAPANGPATITVPGLGSWALSLWLTDEAGNNNPANAAHTNLIVPTNKALDDGASGGSGSSASSSASVTPSLPGSSRKGRGGPKIPKAKLRLSETLHGHELIVHVSGPTTGRVRVSYTGRLHDRTVAFGTKTILLKHERLIITFRLGPYTAAHATILVSAKLDHGVAMTNTLHRRTSPSDRSRNTITECSTPRPRPSDCFPLTEADAAEHVSTHRASRHRVLAFSSKGQAFELVTD